VASHTDTRFPKNKIRVLLLENVHDVAVKAFESQGFQVELKVALSEAELIERLEGSNGHEAIHAIGVRSKTALDAKLLSKAKRLLCAGCFCIGTDNHDLPVAAELGIPIFNAPFSNTRSVAELVIGEIIAVSRQLLDRSTECHRGAWFKVSKGCYEVRGKTLGIIGYGHVGSQVSVLAEGLGMRVVYYDVVPKLALGNAVQLGSMEEVLRQSLYVTMHVPQLPTTRNLITATEIALMPKGSYLLNASRGDVVNVDDFATAIKEMHLAGGSADVFPKEPKKNGEAVFDSPLCGLPNDSHFAHRRVDRGGARGHWRGGVQRDHQVH
jgi:D-3-phosphoglycerate dehydrogenase